MGIMHAPDLCFITGQPTRNHESSIDAYEYYITYNEYKYFLHFDVHIDWKSKFFEENMTSLKALMYTGTWPLDDGEYIKEELLDRLIRQGDFPKAGDFDAKVNYFLGYLYKNGGIEYKPFDFKLSQNLIAFAKDENEFSRIFKALKSKGWVTYLTGTGSIYDEENWDFTDVELTQPGIEKAIQLISERPDKMGKIQFKPQQAPTVLIWYTFQNRDHGKKLEDYFLKLGFGLDSYVRREASDSSDESKRSASADFSLAQNVKSQMVNSDYFIYVQSFASNADTVSRELLVEALRIDNSMPDNSQFLWIAKIDESEISQANSDLFIYKNQIFDTRITTNRPKLARKIAVDWLHLQTSVLSVSNQDLSHTEIENKKKDTDKKDVSPEKTDDRIKGLVAIDNTNWFQESIDILEEDGFVLLWWDRMPTGATKDKFDTLGQLQNEINAEGYFEKYYLRSDGLSYRSRILDFATESTYDDTKWKEEYPGIKLKDNFSEYIDDKDEDHILHARIVFVANVLEQVESPLSSTVNFEYPEGIAPPRRSNLQPFTRVFLDTPPDSSEPYELTTVNIEKATSTCLFQDNVEGVIGVKELSKEFANILTRLDDDKGMLVGLFGRWGRGKTFFWQELWKYLKSTESNSFYKVEFHAWKYQDTPATWAYLYETIADAYYRVPENAKCKLGYKWKAKLKLNVKRKGWLPIVGASIVVMCWLIGSLLLLFYDGFTMDWWKSLLSILIPGLGSVWALLKYFKREYSSKASALFQKYSQRQSFKNYLGVQSEIQDELRILLRTWIPDKKITQQKEGEALEGQRIESKRILLFVDDIDRCGEEKIIQIIDSLRVMLEDDVISKRVIVLAAIDERVLKRAIKNKYYDLIEKDRALSEKEKRDRLATLTREYMDKLFITGIKLGELSDREKGEIFDAFTVNKGRVNFKSDDRLKDESEPNNKEPVNIEDPKPPSEIIQEEPNDFKPDALSPNEVIQIKESLSVTQKIWESDSHDIGSMEYGNLKGILNGYHQATPRSIKIYYFRYLLAKKIMVHRFREGSDLYNKWHSSNDHKMILPFLLVDIGSGIDPENDIEEKRKLLEGPPDTFIQIANGKEVSMDKKMYLELLKIIEMVVPY